MVEDFSCIVHWRFEIENGIRTSETLRGFFRGKRGNDNSRASITRVTVEKYYSIGEFFTCVQKKPVHVFEMQFNGEWGRKKGMCYARVKKKDSDSETTIIIRFGHPSTVQDFCSTLGEGETPEANRFPIDTFFRISLGKILWGFTRNINHTKFIAEPRSVYPRLCLRFEDWG